MKPLLSFLAGVIVTFLIMTMNQTAQIVERGFEDVNTKMQSVSRQVGKLTTDLEEMSVRTEDLNRCADSLDPEVCGPIIGHEYTTPDEILLQVTMLQMGPGQ